MGDALGIGDVHLVDGSTPTQMASVSATGGLKVDLITPLGDSAMDDANDAIRVNIVAGSSSGAQYTEDAASAGAESLTLAGAVRQDTLSATVDTDGDYGYLKLDSAGRLYTQVQGPAASGDPVLGNPVLMGGRIDSTIPASGTEGDVEPFWLTTRGALAVSLKDVNGTELSSVITGGQGLQVHGPLNVDLAANANPVVAGARASNAVPTAVSTDGDVVNIRSTRTGAQVIVGHDAHDAVVNAVANPVQVGGYASAAAPTDVADADAVRAWYLRNGAQATVLTAAGALIGGDATNGLDVDVTRLPALPAGTNNIGDVDVLTLPALPAGSNNIGDVDVLTVPAPLSTTGGGTEATALRVTVANDSTGVLSVDDNGSTLSIDDGAGSITVDGTVTSVDAGDVAHDAGDSGNPVKVGAKAANALPTAVSNGDRTNNISDLFGRQLTSHIDPAMAVHKAFNATTTQTGTDVWSPASGKRIAVTSVIIGTYGTTAARVILWFGDNADTTYTAGTDQVLVAASFSPSATSKPGLVFTPAFPVFCTTADWELHITTDAGISIDVTVEGYEY